MQTRFEAFAFIGKCASVREPVDQELDTMSAWCGSLVDSRKYQRTNREAGGKALPTVYYRCVRRYRLQ